MKKLFLGTLIFLLALVSKAQNVAINNDGTTAAASAMLDVKSTTKGMLMPRMSSVQRTAIVSPASGLLVFDTDTKTIWTFDGTAWKNLYTSGGGLILPFSQSVNTANSALQIANQGSGAAVEGSSSNDFGIGMTAKTTGAGGWGLYSFSNRSGAKSIYALTDTGAALAAENLYTGNNNTLVSMLNRGLGKTTTVQLANTSSTSANMQIAGNNLGEQLLIYQTNAANSKPAVTINNSGTGEAINAVSTTGASVVGTSSTNNGIKGISNSNIGFAGVYGVNNGTAGAGVQGMSNAAGGSGVYGYSTNGIGVNGYSDNNKAIQGSSNSGTAIYGSSSTGYALETNGKIKIAGGNTNPSAGAVLTSDAQGNATWQQAAPKIAFKAAGIADALGLTNSIIASTFAYPQYSKVEFKSLGYDFGNSYTLFNGTETGTTSTYQIPVTGLYHFDASINFVPAVVFDYTDIEITIMLVRNGQTSTLLRKGSYVSSLDNTSAAVSGDVTLLAGDKIYVGVRQYNLASSPSLLSDSYDQCFFSGHLVFAF